MSTKRQLIDVALQPLLGARFQPTGFPDIGNAVFDRPVRRNDKVEWEKALLVESPQSMANRLEATAWDDATDAPVEVFDGLPYVRVLAEDGSYLTSSRTEAHRLASAFIRQSKLDGEEMTTVIRDRLDLRDDRPLSYRDIAAALFALDPFCLIHGVFFAESAKVWPGQPKIARALTGVIEAYNVERADSGGVKKDHVRHTVSEAAETGGSAEGYGTVPFHRTEWTAETIVAMFCLDLAQLRSYGLPEPATELLATIARWQVRTLLDGGLRLRTACDLEPISSEVTDRDGEPLPEAETLGERIRSLIGECRDLIGDGEPIEVAWGGGKAKKKKG